MWQNIDYVTEFDFALALQNTDPGITGSNNAANADNGLQATTKNGGNGIQSGNTQSVMQPTTIFATIKDIPILGNVRIGNQQDWFGMEHIESARFTDFMERAPLMDAFSGANNNGYTPGISFFDNTEDKNFGWQAGFYKNNVYATRDCHIRYRQWLDVRWPSNLDSLLRRRVKRAQSASSRHRKRVPQV